jgi:hypothetical protein
MFLINLFRRKRERVLAVVQPTVNYFVQNHCAIEMVQVTINTSFFKVLLKHIFFLSFIRIHHNYLLFVLDLLDHQPRPIWTNLSFHLLENLGYLISGFMCKFIYHVTELSLMQSNIYLKF